MKAPLIPTSEELTSEVNLVFNFFYYSVFDIDCREALREMTIDLSDSIKNNNQLLIQIETLQFKLDNCLKELKESKEKNQEISRVKHEN